MIALSASAQVMARAFTIAGLIILVGLAVGVVLYRTLDVKAHDRNSYNMRWRGLTAFGAGLIAAIIVFFIVMGAGGFNEKFKRERGRGDAPRTAQDHIDRRPADWVVNFPDGYGNVATKCIGDGLRGFITSKASGASDLELVPDAQCDGYTPGGGR